MDFLTTLRTKAKAKRGWVVVIAASMLLTVSHGLLYSFGLLMESLMEEFGIGVSETGYVGTSSFGMAKVACLITSPLTTKIGYRLALCVGVTFCVVASITTSFADSISIIYFSYSCLYGVGCSFLVCCAINCPIGYFPDKHRSLAIGMVSAGFNIGVLIFNPVVYALINRFGWRGMMRVMSGIIAMVGYFCLPKFTPAQTEPRQYSRPAADGREVGPDRKDVELEREYLEAINGSDNVVAQRPEPRAEPFPVTDDSISSNKPESRKSRTLHLENDAATENSVQQFYQNGSSEESHESSPHVGTSSVLADFDRTTKGLNEGKGPSSADSLKGFADEQRPNTWLHGLEILRMPEMWLTQLGFVTAAVALSFAYFSTVNMTISSGFSKKTAALVMATMGLTEVFGKIALGVITDRLPIPKIFIVMAANCVGALLIFVMSQIPPSKPYIFFQAAVQGIFVLASIDSLSHSLGEQIFRDEYRLHFWAGMEVSLGVGGTLGAVFGRSVDKTGTYQTAYYGNVGVFLASTALFGLALVYQRLFATDRFILFERVGRRYSAIAQRNVEKSLNQDRNDGLRVDVSGLESGIDTEECKDLSTEITSL
ncbi:monocarboxylate transporter 7-like [Diadema antillarum]|uniref:monocarboxylate transporter 7-like n=1 Tax=Diadema antillarum TaxID=105358 RepID=UPI003A86E9DA